MTRSTAACCRSRRARGEVLLRIPQLLLLVVLLPSDDALASVTVITNKAQWLSTVGAHERIGFTEYPNSTVITNQYSDLGITFTDGDDVIQTDPSYTTDGVGLLSIPGTVTMSFSSPMYAIAFEFTDILTLKLYDGGELFYSSPWQFAGFTPFIGFISTTPFDVAKAVDESSFAMTIDNVFFGPAIPAPGSLLLLVGGFTGQRSRRRR